MSRIEELESKRFIVVLVERHPNHAVGGYFGPYTEKEAEDKKTELMSNADTKFYYFCETIELEK